MFVTEEEQRIVALRDSLPGQVLAGSDTRRYPVSNRIGEGGQGWIFRATWNGSVDVVVKVLRPDVASRDALARFQREAAVLRTMSQQPAPNPHVVRYYDHAEAKVRVPGTNETVSLPFTVLEYVAGETLADALDRETGNGLGLDRSRRLLQHIVLALRDVHAQNIIHRDLKPSNVLIDSASGRELAKVTDFGLAKVFQGDLHRTVALPGATVGYAPPEQFEKGNLRVGRPTDVFSLAAIVFEMLSGVPAFPLDDGSPPYLALHRILLGNRPTFAKTVSRLPRELAARPDIVAALDVILVKALAADPGARYTTVTEFHDAVEAALRPLATASLAVGELPQTRRVFVEPSSSVESESKLGLARTIFTGPPGFSSAPPSLGDSPPGPASQGANDAPLQQWQVLAPAAWPRPLRALAISDASGQVVGVGADGLGYWNGRAWARLALPSDVVPETLDAVAWLGTHVVIAGASPVVRVRAPDATYASFVFNLPGIAFHGAFADPTGVLLAGERTTEGGTIGVIAMLHIQSAGALSLAWVDVPTTGALRAVTREGRLIFACGDGGALVVLQGGHLTASRVCAAPLLALEPAGDGAVVAVGGGGFAFRVFRTLDARLEAVQTTRILCAITRGPDGALYAGGEDRRVLKWTPAGWVRAGATVGAPGATVRGLLAAPDRVVAFCDDGSVLEGIVAVPGPPRHTLAGTG